MNSTNGQVAFILEWRLNYRKYGTFIHKLGTKKDKKLHVWSSAAWRQVTFQLPVYMHILGMYIPDVLW